MTTHDTGASVSRRAALAGIGAGGLALASSRLGASAQDASPAAMAGHPLVGTWIFDRNVADATDAPSIVVFSADGGLLDPSRGVAGAWMATGERTAAWTLIAFIDGGAGGYVAVRSTAEIDEGGDALVGPYSVTIVAPDATVITSDEAESTATRFPIEPIEAGGTPLTGFPTWTPAATPAS